MIFSKESHGSVWKQQVRDHFAEFRLSQADLSKIENTLLAAANAASNENETSHKNSQTLSFAFNSFVKSVKSASRTIGKVGLGYAMCAALSAAATFGLMQSMEDNDPVAELASLPSPKMYPPDFDLEGDPDAFKEIVGEFFSREAFAADIPDQIQSRYILTTGRFFSYAGEPGVTLQLDADEESDVGSSQPAVLYIFKLSDKVERKFPKEKVTKKIASKSGKVKKVNAWREGKYGYTLVQTVAVNE